MKKFLLISTIVALGLGGCAHTKTDAAASSASEASEAEAVCNPGEKCSTGGGVAGPIKGITAPDAEATCNPEDEGYPKCSTGGGVAGPIKGGS
ncbi:hypothetical protein JYT95_01070 [bacterium AH-315-J23]|nr:hypothetical protein [bacterium AH-315-J23]